MQAPPPPPRGAPRVTTSSWRLCLAWDQAVVVSGHGSPCQSHSSAELMAGPCACRQMDWDIDCVVPVPDGARPTAIQISSVLGLPYREGLVKNRYVGRTFIMPDQVGCHPLDCSWRTGRLRSVLAGSTYCLLEMGCTQEAYRLQDPKAAKFLMPRSWCALHGPASLSSPLTHTDA